MRVSDCCGDRKEKLGKPKMRTGDYRFVSFFSGALGLDLGLEAAGLTCVAANEIDPVTSETIRTNKPELRLYQSDIRLLTAEFLCRDLRIEPGELFAVAGGPPCQAFSTAGRRLGLADERGNVFLHFIDLVLDLRPKYALFENVRGLLSAPLRHRPHSQRGPNGPPLEEEELPGGALLHILRALERGGYTTTFTLYNTANYGVPQIRERLIFFASRDGSGVPFVAPTHSQDGSNDLPKWRSLRDALAGLPDGGHVCGRFPEHRLRFFKLLKEGENWRDLPRHLQREAMGDSWNAQGGKTGFYRRLAWDKPSPTLVTRPNMPATALCHPDELRPLSVAEYARIQTFPDAFVFKGSVDGQYRQIGNAVPPRFGECVGKHLLEFAEGRLLRMNHDGRMSRYVGTDHISWKATLKLNQPRLVF